MIDDIITLPWVDSKHRYYVVAKAMRREYDGGDREPLVCVKCNRIMQVFYPSLKYAGSPYLACCFECRLEIRASKVGDLWLVPPTPM